MSSVKTVQTIVVSQKGENTSPEKKKRDFLLDAKTLKEDLLQKIQSIDLENSDYGVRRESINKIYKIRAGVTAAMVSKDRDVDFTISSAEKVKDLVEASKKIAVIMEHFIDKINFYAKKGDTQKAVEFIGEQAKLQETLDTATASLEEIVLGYLEQGIGRKSDLKEYEEKIKKAKNASMRERYAQGMLPSEIAASENLSLEQVHTICAPARADFLSTKKEEIKKAILKKEEISALAERYELKRKMLLDTVQAWAKEDEKLLKALDDLSKEKEAKNEKPAVTQATETAETVETMTTAATV